VSDERIKVMITQILIILRSLMSVFFRKIFFFFIVVANFFVS
jgi:uncharacterized membrane protein